MISTKQLFNITTLIISISVLSGCIGSDEANPLITLNDDSADNNNTLTVYTYDSLAADYGLLPAVIDEFETTTEGSVSIISFPDTGSMVNQLIQEQDNPKADIVMGIDNIEYSKIVEADVLSPYVPERADEIAEEYRFDDAFTLTPFDYGYVGFVYDTESDLSFPEDGISLQELASETYQDQIIIEQPGLSSPGTQLLAWSYLALGEDEAQQFWTSMKDTVLTVTPDWSTAYYNLFLEGEAPIVLSYLTSPAYHIDQEETSRYQAIPITDGYLRQVEGIGVVNNPERTDTVQNLSEAFVDYVLSDTVQTAIPTTQWVFPLFADDSLPKAFSQIINPTAANTIPATSAELADLDTWLTDWNATFEIE